MTDLDGPKEKFGPSHKLHLRKARCKEREGERGGGGEGGGGGGGGTKRGCSPKP